MELILGGFDPDAATAERWGYLTRAFEPGEIEGYVTGIARRIAMSEPGVVRHTKELIASSAGAPTEDGLRRENFYLQHANVADEAKRSIATSLELGGETLDGEQRLEQLLGEVLTREATR